MTNSILLYLIQSEKEIPTQLVPNTAYYIIGKEVRIIDNLGQMSIFKMAGPQENSDLSARIEECEKKLTECENKIRKIYTYLSSFGGDKE